MNAEITAIRAEAARILKEKIVDVVVGFTEGTIPMRAQPTVISKVKDTNRLILDGFCQNNLAAFIKNIPRELKIGILCRGCESRSVRALIIEHQRERENLYLIGVKCEGILDWHKIEAKFNGNSGAVLEKGDKVIISISGKQIETDRVDWLHTSCSLCNHRIPVGVDIQIGEITAVENEILFPPAVGTFEKLTPALRYEQFATESDCCIRCYACREACPMCYCAECFVDHLEPRWMESTVSPAGTQGWQIIRAFHQTGRCVSCGACERACPMNIEMCYLTDKLNADMLEQYSFEPGLKEDVQPPMTTFNLDDKNRFIG